MRCEQVKGASLVVFEIFERTLGPRAQRLSGKAPMQTDVLETKKSAAIGVAKRNVSSAAAVHSGDRMFSVGVLEFLEAATRLGLR